MQWHFGHIFEGPSNLYEEMWASGRRVLSLKGVLDDPKMAVRAAKMMLKTGLLEQFQHINAESLEANSQRQAKES